jgi:ribosomal protein S18 acetylase RimI-like enzyme
VAAKRTARTDAIAWRHAQDALACDASEPWAHGTVLRTPSAPDYWDVNMVRVEHAGLTAPELEAASDRLLAGSRHRKLEVEDEATGAAAQPYFAAKGWIADRNAMMRREGPGAVHADIVEVPLAATRDLDIEWVSEYDDVESVKRFAAQREPILARRGMRAFAIPDVGFTLLAVGDEAAEIDALYVTPSARGHGIGARLIETALAAGGRDVAWIVADDEGRARELYERLGFETVWRPHSFVRRPLS